MLWKSTEKTAESTDMTTILPVGQIEKTTVNAAFFVADFGST
jgi:hypothetical protein